MTSLSTSLALALPDLHLDLGCGITPRNPYGRSALFGIDVRPKPASGNITHVVANLALEPIPFADNFFGSVSAFDFLEHIPRVQPSADDKSIELPFVRLMNEIWRVLAPGGRFYAMTPCYPSPAAFQDPTHVNIITAKTHEYFCGDQPGAAIYGFNGNFRELRSEWVVPKDIELAQPYKLSQKLRWLRRRLTGNLAHFLWELEAIKPSPKALAA